MTPRSQSVSKSTATYQGYIVMSLEHQRMMLLPLLAQSNSKLNRES